MIFQTNGRLEMEKKTPECQCNVFSAGNEKKHWNANASRFAKFFSGNVLSVASWQSVRGNSWEQIFIGFSQERENWSACVLKKKQIPKGGWHKIVVRVQFVFFFHCLCVFCLLSRHIGPSTKCLLNRGKTPPFPLFFRVGDMYGGKAEASF